MEQSNAYSEIFTLSGGYQNYEMENYQNRIIISSWNSSAMNSTVSGIMDDGTNITGVLPINIIQQRFQIFIDSSTAGFNMIHQFSVSAFDTNIYN